MSSTIWNIREDGRKIHKNNRVIAMKTRHCISFLVFFLGLQGCAFDVTRVDYTTVEMETTGCGESFIVAHNTNVNLGTGYSRTLREGTRWDCVGRLKYGDVFQSKDQLMTVEASNIFEAYIVVSAGELVGFYLPAKDAYSALSAPVKLAAR